MSLYCCTMSLIRTRNHSVTEGQDRVREGKEYLSLFQKVKKTDILSLILMINVQFLNFIIYSLTDCMSFTCILSMMT